ncbi:MAG: anion permease [Rhodospirillales bacterium]|nr:anion permease [Rhodospirillales bacterium]
MSQSFLAPFGFKKAASFLVLAGVLFLFFMPTPGGVDDGTMRAAALALFTIGFWATGIWSIGQTALAFFFVAAILQVQPPSVIFSGFSSKAMWLVFGGLAIGASVGYTGLGARLAQSLVTRLGHSYTAIISGIALVCMVLGFLMPSSMGRVVLLVPIVMALAEKLGYAKGSRGHTGMVLATALITFTAAGTILPALVPGVVLAGLAENLYGLTFTYGEYLKLHLPVLGIIKCLFIVAVVVKMFGEPPKRDEDAAAHPPMSREEILLSIILVACLGLWVSDFLHGVAAAWVALGAAVIIFIPGLNLVPAKALNENVDWGSIFYVGAVLGLSLIIAKSGLGALTGKWLLAVFPFEKGADGLNYAYLATISTVTPLLTTNPGVPAVLGPLAAEFSEATGLSIETVLMTQVIGFTNVIVPYQASPVVVAMAMGGVRLIDGVKLSLVITVLGAVVFIPLNYLWWLSLGII